MSKRQKELIKLLGSIAGYNDKGYIWYNHSPAESEMMRAKWRQEVDELLTQIGRNQFPSNLWDELHKPEVVQDDSGVYAERVSAWFSQKNR